MQFVKLNGQGLRESTPGAPARLNRGLDEGRPRSAWSILQLSCGHSTTPETQEVYRLWKPARGKYYCEHSTCHRWVKKQPKVKAKDSGNVPLF
jgi:hypothetical protein